MKHLESLSLIVLLWIGVAQSAGAGDYGPTKPGDNLWDIARQVHPKKDVSRHQIIIALLETNPDAVSVPCNANSALKIGVSLRIPSLADIRLQSKEEAERLFAKQAAEWKTYRKTGRAMACSPPLQNATGVETAVQPGPAAGVPPTPAPAVPAPAQAEPAAPERAPVKLAPAAPRLSEPSPAIPAPLGVAPEPPRAARAVEKAPQKAAAPRTLIWVGLILSLMLLSVAWFSRRRTRANAEPRGEDVTPVPWGAIAAVAVASAIVGDENPDRRPTSASSIHEARVYVRKHLDLSRSQWLLAKVEHEEGIASVWFEPSDYRRLTVRYAPERFSHATLLDMLRQLGVHGEIVDD